MACQNSEVRKKFVQQLIEEKRSCYVYLVSGIKLQGIISEFDDVCLILSNTTDQVVHFHAISTINPISY